MIFFILERGYSLGLGLVLMLVCGLFYYICMSLNLILILIKAAREWRIFNASSKVSIPQAPYTSPISSPQKADKSCRVHTINMQREELKRSCQLLGGDT